MTEHADGVYFDLPEDEYHADPALGSTDIKQLRLSPSDWWWRSPYNTIDPVEREEKSALTLGDAIHKLVLEGRQAFDDAFYTLPEKDSFHDLLETADDIKAWLKERSLLVSGKKDVLVARAIEYSPSVNIWDAIVAECARENPGKQLLKQDQYVRAMYAERFIASNPDTAKMFMDGFPEVSFFWTVDVPGYEPVRCKARIDWLQQRGMVDLKTFSLQRGMSMNKAVMTSIARERYDIQAAHYLAAYGQKLPVFGTDEQEKFVSGIDFEAPKWAWVFQKTTDAPVAKAYLLDHASLAFGNAQHEREGAIFNYCRYRKQFGMETPWIHGEQMTTVGDTELPAWMGQD